MENVGPIYSFLGGQAIMVYSIPSPKENSFSRVCYCFMSQKILFQDFDSCKVFDISQLCFIMRVFLMFCVFSCLPEILKLCTVYMKHHSIWTNSYYL